MISAPRLLALGPSHTQNASLPRREHQQHLCPGLHQRSTDLEWSAGPGEPPVQPRLHPDREGESQATSTQVEGMPMRGTSPQLWPRWRFPGGMSLLLSPCAGSRGSCQCVPEAGHVRGLAGHTVGAHLIVLTIIHNFKFSALANSDS